MVGKRSKEWSGIFVKYLVSVLNLCDSTFMQIGQNKEHTYKILTFIHIDIMCSILFIKYMYLTYKFFNKKCIY